MDNNGINAITTANSNGFVPRLLGKKLEDFRRINEHIYFFSKDNLIKFLSEISFDILEVKSIGHSFEIAHLASRLQNSIPLISIILKAIIKVIPPIGKIKVYINPFTKFIVYARKKQVNFDLTNYLLSIIVPVFNEENYIRSVIEKLLELKLPCKKEIIIVDDGSTDQTGKIINSYRHINNIKVINKSKNEGKGSAVKQGIANSCGDFVIIQDADLEYDPEEIKELLNMIQKAGANVIYGSRCHGRYRKTGSFVRTLANDFLTFLCNFINNLNLSDMETCYKLFNGNLIRSINIKSKGFDFEPEVTCKIARKKISIYEVPISYNARTYYEGKKLRWADGIKAVSAIIRYGLFKRN